jgi:hypothetical protein
MRDDATSDNLTTPSKTFFPSSMSECIRNIGLLPTCWEGEGGRVCVIEVVYYSCDKRGQLICQGKFASNRTPLKRIGPQSDVFFRRRTRCHTMHAVLSWDMSVKRRVCLESEDVQFEDRQLYLIDYPMILTPHCGGREMERVYYPSTAVNILPVACSSIHCCVIYSTWGGKPPPST